MFLQTLILFITGAWIYSAGKSGTNLFQPVESAMRQMFTRRHSNGDQDRPTSPRITS